MASLAAGTHTALRARRAVSFNGVWDEASDDARYYILCCDVGELLVEATGWRTHKIPSNESF